MPREEKKYMAKEISGRLKKSQSVFITNFKSLKATDMDSLREKLEQATSNYLIVKNSLAKKALKDAKLSKLDQLIEGPSSFTLTDSDDPIKAAKILASFAKKYEGFNIKGGYVDGKLLLEKEVKILASLPSREVLLAQVVGGIGAPISGFVFVLSGLLRGFVRALSQLQEKLASEKKEQPGQAQEEIKTDPEASQDESTQPEKQKDEEKNKQLPTDN